MGSSGQIGYLSNLNGVFFRRIYEESPLAFVIQLMEAFVYRNPVLGYADIHPDCHDSRRADLSLFGDNVSIEGRLREKSQNHRHREILINLG